MSSSSSQQDHTRRRRSPHTRLARVSTAVLSLGAVLMLAACGGGVSGGGGNATTATVAKATGKATGSLTMSNWPLYIDPKTVKNFDAATGVNTKYVEDYNSNEEFFGKMQPLLAKGQAGGRSVFLGPSPFIVQRLMNLGYLQKLDMSQLPNVEKNLSASLRNPQYDPGNKFSVPWQSGMMGLAVRKDLAPDIHSACDIFNPKYKGKVEIFTELRQTLGVIMKCQGVDFSKPVTEADFMAAINKVKKATESGQIRRFAGNDWTRDLISGDVVASMGASGDTLQLSADNPNIEWRMPTEGCIVFTNDMVIPVGAPNPTAGYAFMNYVYDPENAAKITEFTHYLSPVDGVKEVLQKTNPKLAKNPLIFPSEEYAKNCSPEPLLSGPEEQRVTAAWNAVING